MKRIFLMALGITLAMQGASAESSAQAMSRVWWIANILDTLRGGVGSVFYDPPRELIIQLWLKNEAGDRTIVVPYQFRELITINLSKDGQPVEVAVTWDADTRQLPSGISVGGATDLLLEQEVGLEARCEIRREDGRLFDLGSYVLSVSMNSLGQQLRFDDGTPWRGYLNLAGGFPFEIRRVTNQAELKTSLALAARASMRKREYSQAIPQFQRLIAADASEPEGHIGLGQAYFGLRQYPQAIAAYEQGLARLAGTEPRALLVYPLAYAYVATGQDGKAVDVLRLVLPADKISAEINNYRKRQAR